MNWAFPKLKQNFRAIDAKIQKYGEPIVPGHKKDFSPLNKKDIQIIRNEIKSILDIESSNK